MANAREELRWKIGTDGNTECVHFPISFDAVILKLPLVLEVNTVSPLK